MIGKLKVKARALVGVVKRERGFTLIELLVVVAVLSILSMIIIPNFMNSIQRAKQKRTMMDLRSIATALETYNMDHASYPTATGFAAVLIDPLFPSYMKVVPTQDGWGHDMLYGKLDPDADGADYILWSLGRDGNDDGNDGDDGETTDLNADIVIFDGMFTQWPSGVQQ